MATMQQAQNMTMRALPGLPAVEPGADLAALIRAGLTAAELTVERGDILVVAHKIVSKAEGRLVDLRTVTPSPAARELAAEQDRDPRLIEVILGETRRVVRRRSAPAAGAPASDPGSVLICEHRLGLVAANAAVDASNVPGDEWVALLPEDPDASARRLRAALATHLGVAPGVIISDTFGRPWRRGLVNVAIGLAGVPGVVDLRGERDAEGRELVATQPAFADEVAAAAGLLMGKSAAQPAVLVRGLAWRESPAASARDLVRVAQEDLFR